MNFVIDIISRINQMNIAWRYIVAIIFYIFSIICLNISEIYVKNLQVANHIENTAVVIAIMLVQSIAMLILFIIVFVFQENKQNILQNLKTNIISLSVYIIYAIFSLLTSILYVYILSADKYPLYNLRFAWNCTPSIVNLRMD